MKKNLRRFLAQTQKITNIHINDDNINILFISVLQMKIQLSEGGEGFHKLV